MHGGQGKEDTFVDRRGFMAAAGGGFAASLLALLLAQA
jgi:hypothetical protein